LGLGKENAEQMKSISDDRFHNLVLRVLWLVFLHCMKGRLLNPHEERLSSDLVQAIKDTERP
jgi:hypothetical protein